MSFISILNEGFNRKYIKEDIDENIWYITDASEEGILPDFVLPKFKEFLNFKKIPFNKIQKDLSLEEIRFTIPITLFIPRENLVNDSRYDLPAIKSEDKSSFINDLENEITNFIDCSDCYIGAYIKDRDTKVHIFIHGLYKPATRYTYDTRGYVPLKLVVFADNSYLMFINTKDKYSPGGPDINKDFGSVENALKYMESIYFKDRPKPQPKRSKKSKWDNFSYIVYELDADGQEVDELKAFKDKEKAISFAKSKTFPTHVVFVPNYDPDSDPEAQEYIQYNAPYDAYEIIWDSFSN